MNKSRKGAVTTDVSIAVPGKIRSLLRGHPEPILLLGAGASITSGIPAAADTSERVVRWRWCHDNDIHPDDPSVRKADYWPWLLDQPWFDPDRSLADLYPTCIERLLNVATDRRDFFEKLINPQVPPSSGYKALANILQNGWISTVLTTNFDKCLQRAAVLQGRPHHLVVIKTDSDLIRFTSSPDNPQLIYLHGSVEHYTDKNLEKDVQSLDGLLIENLRPLLRDHPLVVVGYRGTELSVMNGLFLNQLDYTNRFARGIYWCQVDRGESPTLSPLVEKLSASIGGNFNTVNIDGFDELLLSHLWDPLRATDAPPRRPNSGYQDPERPFDMRPFESSAADDLDLVTMFRRLKAYATVLKMWSPDKYDDDWTFSAAERFNLVVMDSDSPVPTFAGWMLFAQNPGDLAPQSFVKFSATGPLAWLTRCFGEDADLVPIEVESDIFRVESEVAGSLWSQMDQLIDLLSLVNPQFRLKEEVSRQVRGYSPIAIKEILVNALVHRDYQNLSPVTIDVQPSQMTVASPGGLIAAVESQLSGEKIQTAVGTGGMSVKGYRNPVIADLFYGGGLMDHIGSGLADILHQTINNNGNVEFGPEENNSVFVVRLSPRSEALCLVGSTAISAGESRVNRFATNIVPFVELPRTIWHAGTTAYDVNSLIRSAENLPVPSGYIHGGRFYSFYDLETLADVMVSPFDPGDIEPLSVDELLKIPHGENIVIRLLKESVFEHLKSVGLWVDYSKDRAHYMRTDDSPEIKITYRGRVKRATRTVVKQRTKRGSTEVSYYEHKAIGISIMRFENDWAVLLSPGYAFTRNGYGRLIGRDMTNRLSTRRAAKDFNSAVHHDVTFWLAMMSGETTGTFALGARQSDDLTSFAPSILLSGRVPTISFGDGAFDSSEDDEQALDLDLEELGDEIAALAEKEEEELGPNDN